MKRSVAYLFLSTCLFAQSERGTISGLVSDPSGAAISGAELVAVNTATNATARNVTSNSGEFNIPNLVPGSYRLEVTATGFKRIIQQNVIVAAASSRGWPVRATSR